MSITGYIQRTASPYIVQTGYLKVRIFKKMKEDNINEITLDFQPFYDSLARAGISQNRLKTRYEISGATLNRMKHGHNMTLASIGRLMKILGTDDLNDIVILSARE